MQQALASPEATPLELAYHEVNRSYGDPLVLQLTRRGFFSEIVNLITVMTFCLVNRRRLVVDQSRFNDMHWGEFFQTVLPGIDVDGPDIKSAPVLDDVFHPLFDATRQWIEKLNDTGAVLDIPALGISGNVFEVKRALSTAFCIPRRQIRRDAERAMKRMGLERGQFAALHVRRGDKITVRYASRTEGEATSPDAYFAALQRYAPSVRDVFVLTDDARFLGLLRDTNRSLRLHSLCPANEGGHWEAEFNARPPARKREEITRLLTEVEIAVVSSPFLGGFKSNVSRYIANVHMSPPDCHSVDRMVEWIAG